MGTNFLNHSNPTLMSRPQLEQKTTLVPVIHVTCPSQTVQSWQVVTPFTRIVSPVLTVIRDWETSSLSWQIRITVPFIRQLRWIPALDVTNLLKKDPSL